MFRSNLLLAGFAIAAQASEPAACLPAPQVQAELSKAAALPIADPFAAAIIVEPFRALRERYPGDLFVHERYQDAVHEHGIEGHLEALAVEYQAIFRKHPEDPVYRYLSLRASVGRGTPAVIAGLTQLLSEYPDFAPAHRTLAEIYSTAVFHDAEKEKSERGYYLALCPAGPFTRRPPTLPEPSKLLDQAESLLTANADPDRILALTDRGLRESEWRNQRVRAFDWYSSDFKRQSLADLRDLYWRGWTIQLRCHQIAGHTGEADRIQNQMRQFQTRRPQNGKR